MSDLQVPALISLNEVCRLTSLSRTSVNRFRAAGQFPVAVPLSSKRVAFMRDEVQAWVFARIGERAVAQHARQSGETAAA